VYQKSEWSQATYETLAVIISVWI